MTFSFSAAPAAPAPSTGFSFGAPAAAGATTAPAPGTSLFGAPSAAPAPAGGGLFGAPAPAGGGGLFGAKSPAPAPTAGGGLFGAPAPAGGSLFGAPAPAGGGLFGSTAPAPATGGWFGAAPAPAAGGLFGATPAPAPTGGLFGAPAPPAAPPMAPPPVPLSGNTPYSQLPDGAKRAVDQIYQLMMQHRRTVASVQTMAPSLLTADDAAPGATGGETPSPADAAAGSPRRAGAVPSVPSANPSAAPLPRQMLALHHHIQTLLQSAETNLASARHLKARAGESAVQAKMHGAWPVEGVAARRGVALSSVKDAVAGAGGPPTAAPGGTSGGAPASAPNLSGMTNVDAVALQQIMDMRASRVDRLERLPSPYFWEVLHEFERRVEAVQRDVRAVGARLAIAEEAERVRALGVGGARRMLADDTSLLLAGAGGAGGGGAAASLVLYEAAGGPDAPLPQRLAALARAQSDLFLRIAARAARAHEGLEEAKLRYQRHCRAARPYYEDPFLRADVEEIGREREVQRRIVEEQLSMASPPKAVAAPGTAAPAAGGLFGAPAPAPGGLFGAPAPAAGGSLFGAPAPSPAGGLFGSTPASAPAGGLFGAPAPAPSTGGLFGAPTPAPATGGGLFGAPAPAPAAGGLFGSTPAPAPAAAGGLFGSTPAPAPAGGGLFGATPAPAPVFGAAPTTPASTLAPRKKSGSRSGGRRR